jgi:hypothetical protein
MIDWDCDGYGPGSPLGPDADDNDASVNTSASAVAKYGSTSALLAHLGYTPLRMLFISTSGNDSTGQPNNAALPYASWNGVVSLLQPGDAVIWRAGTYAMSSPMYIVGGTAANPNLYMAYPGEKVILDWSAANSATNCCSNGFNANDVSYWGADGLVMNGGTDGYGVDEQGWGTPTNITFRHMEFIGWYDQLFIQGGFSNLTIQNNYFHDLTPYGEHNLYLGANPNITTGLVIKNNIIAKAGLGGGHNIHLNGRFTGAYIAANILYGAENETFGLQEGVNHSTFENNIVYTDIHGPFFFYDYADYSDSANIAFDQSYNVFRNNTFYYDGGDYYNQSANCGMTIGRFSDFSGSTCVKNGGTCSGLTCSGGTGGSCNYSNQTNASHDLGHNTFDNNVMVVGCTGPWAAEAALRFDQDINGGGGLAWLQTDTFHNNVIYVNGTYQYNFLMVDDFTDSMNFVDGTSVSYTFAQFEAQLAAGLGTNLQSNPMLVAANPNWYNTPQNFNLQVQAGSPVIGAAFAADAPATDIMGKSRGSAPDIGAYQYGGGTSTGIALTINTAAMSSGTVGTAYSQSLSASGGTAPYSWLLTSGSLPSGLVLSSTGLVSGTPLAAATSTFTIELMDSAGATASATWSIPVAAVPVTLSSLSCAASSLASSASTTCTVTLSAAAPTGGTTVALASSSTLLNVPSTVTVAAGSSSGSFTASAGSVPSDPAVVVTATLAGVSTTANLSLQQTTGGAATSPTTAATLLIQGTASEVSAVSNSAIVTPTTAPAGLTGQLTVRGSGSVNYASNGVSFKTGGQQNGNTAFYSFTGSQLQNVFNVSQGQISFNLTSSYAFAARQQLPQYSYRDVFDGFDNSQELFIFQVQAEYGRLIFYYNTGGTSAQGYWVPAGTEDTLFGQGVAVQVKMVWNAGTLNLYLNGTLVSTNSYTPATPNWTSTSSFTFGANDQHVYGGGYFSCDDVISGFQVQNTANSSSASSPTVSSLQCSPTSLASGASANCTVTLSAASPSNGSSVSLASNNTLLTVPSSVAVASGATSAGFAVTAGTVSSSQASSVTASLSGTSQSASISLTAPAATVSSLQCAASSLASSGSATCTVTLSAAAPTGGSTVALTSSNTLLTVPSSVTVAAGASSAGFTATASAISSGQTASVTATLSGTSQSASISLTAPAATVSSLKCATSSLASSGSTTCTVTLSAAAPTGGSTVALTSSNTPLTVPSSVTVAAGATSAGFTATAGAISSGQTASVTATLNSSSQSTSISLTAPAATATVSSLKCAASSLASSGSTTCTVTLSAAAPTGGSTVALTSSNTSLTVPSSMTVAAGATSAGFTATACAISSGQTASVTATLDGSSQSASISLTAPAATATVSSLKCAASSLTSSGSTTCTVTLNAATATGGSTVALTSSTTSLTVPSSVTVAAGASSASFTATAGAVSANVTAVITATLAGVSTTASLTLQPATSATTASSSSGTLVIQGTRSEVSATSNGAIVTPTTAPAGLTGQLVVRGSGSVNYATNGVSFKTGGQQNGNTAFYSFKGSQVQNVLNVSQGQISFNLTSSYNFAARQQLPQYSYRDVFDGFDNSQELFIFQVQAEYGRLIFYYNTGGTSAQWYWVPVGTEDTLFGQGKMVQVKIAWNAGTLNLYLNGTLVSTNSYKVATPNWTSSSSFTFGANDVHVYSGGYYSCDDVIAGFQLQNVAPSGTN